MAKITTSIKINPSVSGGMKKERGGKWNIEYNYLSNDAVKIHVTYSELTKDIFLNTFEDFEEFLRDLTIAYNHFRDIKEKKYTQARVVKEESELIKEDTNV